MSFNIKLFAVACIVFLCQQSWSQNENGIFFKSGIHHPGNNRNPFHSTAEHLEGNYYRLIQFNEVPTNQEKSTLASNGIELLNYIPHNAFFARVSVGANLEGLEDLGILSFEPIKPRFKLTYQLFTENYPHWALFGTDQIELNGIYFDGVSEETAHAMLRELGAEIINSNTANTIRLRIELNKLDQLYALNGFYYFEAIGAPEEPENLDGRTNHRSNMLATDYSTGLQYDGTGVIVMMQDDGYIGDHIDYEGRIDQSNCSGCSSNDANNHGDHVAGTIMGAGNLNPRYKGMAFGAQLLVFNSSNDNYDDVPNLYATQDLVITSKSYSAGCNGGYDSRARQLDQQVHDLQSLIHVFSAGNSGNSDCGYGAGAGWGNITGGHKSGKNVIAVGNLTTTDALAGSSSRGPATDGRIKPDICGVGSSVVSTISDYEYEAKTGTSMSCPGVAGTITQLYHAYKEENGGANPTSGLIKAALLNTAEDLGNPGPDFQYGWGRINGGKAHNLISQGDYITSSIAQSGFNTHTLAVPSGVTKLKIMVYWTDYEGAANASIALVNNLNMEVIDPALVAFNPWVLDPSPNAATLDLNAVQGVDNLNNMEQVTIDNPLSGSYTINIDAFSVPQGPQEYFIVYEFERDEVLLTYPIGGEGFYPGTNERLRWDASEGVDDFTLEYTEDNGASWSTIGTVNANVRQSNWSVPNTLTGEAKVRVTRGAQSDESDAPFSIIRVPANLDVGWACPDSLNLVWDAVSGATSYEVYMLGTMYMDSIGTTTATNFTVQSSATDENWYSVRAFGPNNARSERAIAIRKLPGQFGCTWSSPLAAIDVVCDSISSTDCAEVLNESLNVDAASSYLWYFPNGTPTTSTDENPTVCFPSSGYQDAALVVTNSAGSDSVYFSNFVFVQGAMELPYHEGFENMVTFNGQENWSTYNPDVNSAFLITGSASLSGSKSARLYNHGQDEGSIDDLISGPINLAVLDPVNDIVTLSFRYAYRKRDDNTDDWLRLYAKRNCGDNWSLKKTLHGEFLSTINYNPPWTPSDSSDWTTVHVTNITSTYFTGDFRFKFNFENGNGNNLFLDDINIYAGSPSDDIISGINENEGSFNFGLFPNPADNEVNVRFDLQNASTVRLYIHDISGKISKQFSLNGTAGSNLAIVETTDLDAGVYFMTLKIDGSSRTEQFILK
jgi:hypothetical protein